ncbi:oxidoreductase [Planctomicrobium piriforme]|uniref:2,4-dienoyl-CoA reductase n=1 Tax=Planctomicrobium piriforme TaxID=1576369 RepID=A0A1I3CG80_9PLAN|nr:NADH:flavin oxidoreductase [Planctomicrobium piriforme]SFH73219.1 2,4-dienoyl-CoA reductase [Planctomicrobium piriforme]
MSYPRIATLKNVELFRQHTAVLGIDLPCDDQIDSSPSGPLAQAYQRERGTIGNRFCILPMEGWDGETEGRPSDLTRRRWQNFGLSGAKLIWGGEAVAVQPLGRANPNQLLINEQTLPDIIGLRELLVSTHVQQFGTDNDLLVGLQLTHSGRFARPRVKSRPEPRIAYRHPVLDAKVGVVDDAPILSDDELKQLIDDFIRAAVLADQAGYAFVDIKHCHGYLGHEILSGFDRPGIYGGTFENRTRFLRDIVAGINAAAPNLEIGVRISLFDFVPYQPGPDRTGVPAQAAPYRCAFGGDGTGLGIDLTEPKKFLELLRSLGIELVCSTVGSPYYNPHIQRPALFPPSDGYLPPEDPLVGVARQINITAELKRAFRDLIVVGSGYSYLQEWLPHVGQRAVRDGNVDFVGLGRMVLSYPELPADVLSGKGLQRKKICRTFSDCTTAPRNGMVSGCYPLDPFYKSRPEREKMVALKQELELHS